MQGSSGPGGMPEASSRTDSRTGRTEGNVSETNMPAAELLFGPDDSTPISTDQDSIKPWAQALESFAAAPKYWLATARPNGRPHVMPVLAVCLRESLYVSTRPTSRKGKNLAHEAHCVLTVSTDAVDLVVECTATEVTDDAHLRRAADAFAAKYQWRLTVRDGHAHEDGLPGSPIYGLFDLTPDLAFGFGPDGLTATRWRFPDPLGDLDRSSKGRS